MCIRQLCRASTLLPLTAIIIMAVESQQCIVAFILIKQRLTTLCLKSSSYTAVINIELLS